MSSQCTVNVNVNHKFIYHKVAKPLIGVYIVLCIETYMYC